MNCRNIVKNLESDHFTKIKNRGKWFEEGAEIYAKEIRENIFLLFIVLKDSENEDIKALIAKYYGADTIGIREPEQIMFYLSVKCKEDLHYFEKYIKNTESEPAKLK